MLQGSAEKLQEAMGELDFLKEVNSGGTKVARVSFLTSLILSRSANYPAALQ